MTIFSRTRASVLASLCLTIADPPPATADMSHDGARDRAGISGARDRSLSAPWTGLAGGRRQRHEIFDRLEL